MPAAYFDVDGTLVGTNLLHTTFIYLANQANLLQSATRLGKVLLQAPALAAAEAEDRRKFNEKLFFHFKGMSEDRMVLLSEEVHETAVVPRIFPGTQQLIEQCKRAGYRVVLVTGSLEYTVAPLAKHFGADGFIANRLEMKDGYATGRLLRPVVAGPAKARLIVNDALAHGDDLGQCQAYSDSYSDVPMLSVVGHPFCINPDAKLERLARNYDWAVIDISRTRTSRVKRRAFGFFS